MNEIKPSIVGLQDEILICLSITVDAKSAYDICTIEPEETNIVSTSAGAIYKNKIILQKEIKANVYIKPPSTRKIKCLVSFLRDNELIDYEHIEVIMPVLEHSTKTRIKTIYTEGDSFAERQKQISDKLRDVGQWSAKVTFNPDIVISFNKKGTDDTVGCFGQESEGRLSSDFVFKLDPKVPSITIPIEVFWDRYEQYNAGKRMGIFEWIRADFHSAKNIYYKRLISNSMELSKFPKIQLTGNTMSSPTGEGLNPAEWSVNKFSLPKRKG